MTNLKKRKKKSCTEIQTNATKNWLILQFYRAPMLMLLTLMITCIIKHATKKIIWKLKTTLNRISFFFFLIILFIANNIGGLCYGLGHFTWTYNHKINSFICVKDICYVCELLIFNLLTWIHLYSDFYYSHAWTSEWLS